MAARYSGEGSCREASVRSFAIRLGRWPQSPPVVPSRDRHEQVGEGAAGHVASGVGRLLVFSLALLLLLALLVLRLLLMAAGRAPCPARATVPCFEPAPGWPARGFAGRPSGRTATCPVVATAPEAGRSDPAGAGRPAGLARGLSDWSSLVERLRQHRSFCGIEERRRSGSVLRLGPGRFGGAW